MQVLELQDRDREEWDSYVLGSARATVFQLAGWQAVMQGALGLRCHFLLAKEGEQMAGVLPLLHVQSKLAGHFFTSMPGGICAEGEIAAHALVEHAKELVRANRASYLILRDSRRRWDLADLVTNDDHVTLMVQLAADPNQVLRNFQKRTRQLVNSALRNGLRVKTGTEHLEGFYPTYALAMRDLGTPSPGIGFFRNIVTQFPAFTNLITIYSADRVVGGGFLAPFRDTVYCTWAGLLREFYEQRSSHLLIWETIRYGCQEGFQWVDLGRCKKGSGGYVFKKDFGSEGQQLYQQFYLNGITQPPAVGAGMEEELKYRLFVKIWRRLPLPVAEALGPQLRRRMPFG